MKRLLTFLTTFSLVESIGRHPVTAGVLMMLGVGGGVAGVALLTTPTIVPQPASYFNMNQSTGNTNNALLPNGGSTGAFALPTTATNSFAILVEGSVDPSLGYGVAQEYALGTGVNFQGLMLTSNSSGQPVFVTNKSGGGSNNGTQWWSSIGTNITSFSATVAGSAANYFTGLYPFTASGGGCAREPSGVWNVGGSVDITDPGFLCETVPTVSVTGISGDGAQQATGAGGVHTTCVSNSPVSGEMTVTAHVAVAHGMTPGQTFPLQGFTAQTGYNVTYTALPGTSGTTLVGETTTGAGTCPTSPATVEGTALSGAGVSITLPAISTSAPFNSTNTGVTTHNAQHFCAIIGEDGADSPFPGAQFFSAVDDKGNALPGAPALVPWLNQGTANFTGFITTSNPALTVTALKPYTITAATFSATTGFATFTTSTNPGFVPGSEFTVSGVTSSGPGSFNLTYVAAAGTSGTTIVGNPLSGSVGTPQASSLTAASTMTGGSSPQMVSVIMPNTQVLGSSAFLTAVFISPYGTGGSTGTGGVGTYNLNVVPFAFSFTGRIDNGTLGSGIAGTVLTVTGTPQTPLVVGTNLRTDDGVAPGTTITALGTGTGGAGTYIVNNSQLIATAGTMAGFGSVGSSGSPVTLFDFPNFYYTGFASSIPGGGAVTPRASSTLGEFITEIGNQGPAVGVSHNGWGGTLANVAMLQGIFPQGAGGAPSTTALASLCMKATTIPTFAAANGMTVHSLYRLNDVGVWADSSVAQFQGYIDSASGTTATLHVTSSGSPLAGSATGVQICGPGVAGGPTACPTTTLGAGPTYTLTWGSSIAANLASIGAPVTLAAGTFKPAKPINQNIFNGYIDDPSGTGATPTLHITSIAAGTGTASFTGSLGTGFSGTISGNTLTVTSASGVAVGVGTTINPVSGTPFTPATVTALGTGSGGTGTYTIDGSPQTLATATQMIGQGILPGPAMFLLPSGITGTIVSNMDVTDGGVNISPNVPLLVINTNGPGWNIAPNYYPPFSGDATMVGALSGIVPGEYILNSGISTAVKVVGNGSGSTGLLGTYPLSACPNPACAVGSSGSPVALTGTTISDAGAPAPGPALTIKDLGPGVTFAVNPSTISCSSFGNCTGTGTVSVSGAFDTSVLGGTPVTIQAQISTTAGGPPVPGCTACAWTNLSGYSATVSSGTVFKWSGSALNIPASAGPLYVSVRASNGTAYATMPNLIKVGFAFDWYGEGQGQAISSGESGFSNPYLIALSGLSAWGNGLVQGPPVVGSYVPAQTTMSAGDRFGTASGSPEAVTTWDNTLALAFGWPTTLISAQRDATGIISETIGEAVQTQSIGVGDGSTTQWCSASKFCGATSTPVGIVGQGGVLTFNAAGLTGGQFTGSVGGAGNLILSAATPTFGSLMPGMVLSGPGIGGTITLANCLTGCAGTNASSAGTNPGTASTWALNSSPGAITSETMRVDPVGGAPFPLWSLPVGNLPYVGNSNIGWELIKPGTFKLAVNGTTVCQDSTAFAYNNEGGNCTGAGISSSFVDYHSGDYDVVFTTAPASNAVITASWTNIVSPDPGQFSNQRPSSLDFFGDGTTTSGPVSSIMGKTPNGDTGHVDAGGVSDATPMINMPGGFQSGAIGYTQMISWLYGTRWPNTIPGQSAATPFLSANSWRSQGPNIFWNVGGFATADWLFDQWGQDVAMKSTFSGTVSGSTLTLTSNAVGPMWEGEIIGCAPLSLSCGIDPTVSAYITKILTGTWGASGSTYAIVGSCSGSCTNIALQNAVYYQGPGPAFYVGPQNDISVQAGTLQPGVAPHASTGFQAGRRVGARWAANTWGGLTTPANASDPTLDRVKADASGCDAAATAAPCFDIGNTFAASHSATLSATSSTITVTGGLSANQRPFVVGQLLSCSGCTAGRFITALSVPATQDTRTGNGEVGQTFTITANGTMGHTGTETVSAGCSGTSGTGSNCIDIAIKINTTNGTYGTTASLATCGENNSNGNAPSFQVANGTCQTNGIGSLARGFRIGTQQGMAFASGSPYDDGLDPGGGVTNFNRSSPFTCNIVSATVVQCVKGAAYTSGVPTSVGLWASGSTFMSYGDSVGSGDRFSSLMGNAGGQSFPITSPGSGYVDGTYTLPAQTCTLGTSLVGAANSVLGVVDVTVLSGAIIDVYPSGAIHEANGVGMGTGCTFPVDFNINASLTSTLLTVNSSPAPGGTITVGSTITDGPGGHVTTPVVVTSFGTGSGGAGTYHVSGSPGTVASETMIVGLPIGAGGTGTGGAIAPAVFAPVEGAAGIATYNTDNESMGALLYDNSMIPGNPLAPFQIGCTTSSGYCEPGLPVHPWGEFQGAAVRG